MDEDIISVEKIDQFIDEFLLDETVKLPKEAQFLYFFIALSERLKQRNLIPLKYRSQSRPHYECYALQFTGEPLQEEVLRKWLAPNKVYICEGPNNKPFFFSPSNAFSVSAKVNDYILCETNNNRSLTILTKEGFEKDFIYEG